MNTYSIKHSDINKNWYIVENMAKKGDIIEYDAKMNIFYIP